MSITSSFKVGIEFDSVLRAISKQIYETPMAFIRENVQNAVDAIRIQAFREGVDASDDRYLIVVETRGNTLSVSDNGIGMSEQDLRNLFWTIGASGKRTGEASKAGCVGMFGIGGFANFGVCDKLEVISQSESTSVGTYTALSQADIQAAGMAIPSVTAREDASVAPRGTRVVGHLRAEPKVEALRSYLRDFVRFVPIAVEFNGERISQTGFSNLENQDNLTEIMPRSRWSSNEISMDLHLYEDRGHTIVARVEGLKLKNEDVQLHGQVRFESGPIDVFKRGFKLCATQAATIIGVSGRLDCDLFTPTAGRDSLDASTAGLLGRIASFLEDVAVQKVLEDPARIAENARVFRYVLNRNYVDRMGRVPVTLADASETLLGDIKRRFEQGGVGVYFGTSQKQALNQIMHARGHIVVLLASETSRRNAEKAYLERYCGAKAFDGMIECLEVYTDLTRFEKVFLSEVENSIARAYEVKSFRLVAGKLTEDIPVFVKDQSPARSLELYVDVRHPEISKLEAIGFNQLLYSLVGSFVQEYLGSSLKRWSPRFFGDGALNLELLAKRRSELWILLKDDIGTVRKGAGGGGQRQIVTRSDVQIVRVGNSETVKADSQISESKRSRILHIVGAGEQTNVGGYYIRLPDAAYRAYGDLLPDCESRGVVWAGNKILYVASDAVTASFQYEIRLDEVVVADLDGHPRAEGAVALDRPLQTINEGLYFPIPAALERYLVPQGDAEIRLELHCDWIDMRTSRQWAAKGA